jgi:CRP-like cAMP-binding protein
MTCKSDGSAYAARWISHRTSRNVVVAFATQPITIPINQETLAEIIGTTRPRVSHFMNKFRKLGFISYNGHLASTVR